MKRLAPAVVVLGFIGSSPASAAETRYAIGDFEQIQVVGPFSVTIRTGRATSVMASGDAAALEAVSVETSGGVLKIQAIAKSRSSWKEDPHPAAKFVVVVPRLKGLRLLGSGTITASEMRGIATSIVLNGSGQINVTRLATDGVSVRLNGSGRVTMAGTAKNFDANVSGSGDLDAAQLAASDLKLMASSSGVIKAWAMRTADIKQNGAGSVRVKGKPSCIVENLGAGSVTCGD